MKKTSIFSVKLSQEELTYQVKNYDSLKITESYRGISALLLIFSVVLTLVAIPLKIISELPIINIVILISLAYFIYKGHSWAIIIAALYWTFGTYLVYLNHTSALSLDFSLLFWIIFLLYFYKAWQVERARNENKVFSSS